MFLLISFLTLELGAEPPLPQWTKQDRERVKKGEFLAGGSLLVGQAWQKEHEQKTPEEIEKSSDRNVPDGFKGSSEESEEGVLSEKIPEKFLDDYFERSPTTYLIDPQRLFSNQETADREGFLKYYARESNVAIRIYLFDKKQKIPDYYTLNRLVEERYAEGPLTAVVFYFLGAPERNQLLFGGQDANLITTDSIRKMLDIAVVKAMEKSDPSAQMESFLVQLSISIYWAERRIEKIHASQHEPVEVVGGIVKKNKHKTKETLWETIQPYFFYGVVGVLSGILVLVSLTVLILWWRRSRKYYFVELDIPRRLGADYAAEAGTVLKFSNKQESPLKQKGSLPNLMSKR